LSRASSHAASNKPVIKPKIPAGLAPDGDFIFSLFPLYFFLNSSTHNRSMTEESIQFHIRSNDYFGTLATVLDLLRQDAQAGYTERHDATLQRLRDDLLYLQHGFCITVQPQHWSQQPPQKTPEPTTVG